jgi:hypothetical protein
MILRVNLLLISTVVQALEKHNQKERDPAGCNGSALLCLQSAIAARCLLLHAASQHATGKSLRVFCRGVNCY